MQRLANIWRNHSCQYVGVTMHTMLVTFTTTATLASKKTASNTTQIARTISTLASLASTPAQHVLQCLISVPTPLASSFNFSSSTLTCAVVELFTQFSPTAQGPLVGWNVLEPHVTTKTTKYVVANDIGNFTLVYGVRDACLPFPGVWHYALSTL